MSDHKTAIASYASSGGIIIAGGVTLNDIAVGVGIVCAIGTFFVNWYYRHQALRLALARESMKCEECDR